MRDFHAALMKIQLASDELLIFLYFGRKGIKSNPIVSICYLD